MGMSIAGRRAAPIDAGSPGGGVAICIDRSARSRKALPHARAIANALGASATLLHVLKTRRTIGVGPDPIEWDLLRREARNTLDQCAKSYRDAGDHAEAEIIEGHPAEQICRWARDHAADLIVLCARGEGESTASGLGSTAREVIDQATSSVLLVPPSAELETGTVRYQRILVPLDGSPSAESVMPLATRIAAAHGAELLLVHVVPVPELTEPGPAEAEDAKLLDDLVARNETAARQYLNRLKTRIAQRGVNVRVLALRGGDVRGQLPRVAAEQGVDLVILSAHGRSNRSDMPYGSVTSHLITHLTAPVMIVRPKLAQALHHITAPTQPMDVRLPSRAVL